MLGAYTQRERGGGVVATGFDMRNYCIVIHCVSMAAMSVEQNFARAAHMDIKVFLIANWSSFTYR